MGVSSGMEDAEDKSAMSTPDVPAWSVIPIFLKPDALEGDATQVSGKAAADFVAYLSEALSPTPGAAPYVPFVPESKRGAERAQEHSSNEMRVVSWYTSRVNRPHCVKQRLCGLRGVWVEREVIEIPELVEQTSLALGFEVTLTNERRLSVDDYMKFYGETDRPDMHASMQEFMVGKRVRLYLLCGQQENSALQVMKTYLRYVLRHPIAKRTIRNWLHVTNPNASNYPELLRMYR